MSLQLSLPKDHPGVFYCETAETSHAGQHNPNLDLHIRSHRATDAELAVHPTRVARFGGLAELPHERPHC